MDMVRMSQRQLPYGMKIARSSHITQNVSHFYNAFPSFVYSQKSKLFFVQNTPFLIVIFLTSKKSGVCYFHANILFGYNYGLFCNDIYIIVFSTFSETKINILTYLH